jgi:formate dehydrogenase
MRETIRLKGQLKGRQADGVSLDEVRALIGQAPHRRDVLIEYLHKLNDTYRCLYDRHLVALAKEMNLPMAEVFEVATFYHHFEVIRGDQAVPALTVRVCDGLSCELSGAKQMLEKLPALLYIHRVNININIFNFRINNSIRRNR